MKYFIFITLLFSNLTYSQNDDMKKTIEMIDRVSEQSNRKASEFLGKVQMRSVSEEVNPSQLYQVVDNSLPKINEVATVYMGERMIHTRSGYFAECIKPQFSTEDYFFGAGYEIKENILICKTDREADGYIPSYINFKSKKRENILPVTVRENKNGTYKVCVSDMGVSKACKDNASSDELQMKPAFISIDGSLQKTIEYIGVSNGVVKFIYSEFVDGLARDAFTRQFEVNIEDGNIAGWKGAVIEIIDVSNASITFKVIRHFSAN